MNKLFLGVAFSGLALLATFFPMAAVNGYFVNISHIGDVTYLLYALALASLALSITSIYCPQVKYLRLWITVTAVLGVAITALAVTNGIGMLKFMSSTFNSMSFLQNQPVPKVSPNIGMGGILSLIAYLGLLAMQLAPSKAVATIVLAVSVLASSGAEAEEPRPFGLVVGSSTIQQVRDMLEKEGGKIVGQGQRIIDGDISNASVEGMEVTNLSVAEMNRAKFWFYKGTLMEVVYFFPASMNKAEFYRLADQLRAKYGKATSYRKPELSEGLAVWKLRDVEVRLNVAWVASSTTLSYRNTMLVKKAEADDKQVYGRQNNARAKSQKGL